MKWEKKRKKDREKKKKKQNRLHSSIFGDASSYYKCIFKVVTSQSSSKATPRRSKTLTSLLHG